MFIYEAVVHACTRGDGDTCEGGGGESETGDSHTALSIDFQQVIYVHTL